MLLLGYIIMASLTLQDICYAESVAKCSGTTYESCRSYGDTTVWLIDQNDVTTPKPGYIYMPDGCGAITIPNGERKCNDSDSDGQVDEVVSKTPTEIADELAARLVAQEANIKAGAVAQADTDRIIRAVAVCMGQFMNETRSDPNTIKPNLTKAQGIQCIKDRINDGSAN